MATNVASTENGGRKALDSVVIRFAGDSGDGMQLTGTTFFDNHPQPAAPVR